MAVHYHDANLTQVACKETSDDANLEDGGSLSVHISRDDLQCPFTWEMPNDIPTETLLKKTEEKIFQFEDEESEFTSWTKYVLNLILCYQYCKCEKIEEAMEKYEECERIIQESTVNKDLTRLFTVGMKHICLACKYFLLEKKHLYNDCENLLKSITSLADMERRDQASVWGVRGAVYMEYGTEGIEKCISFLGKAVELDPNCGEWHYLLGKALGAQRRGQKSGSAPADRELEALEEAVRITNNPFYMVTLARSYYERGRRLNYIYNIKKAVNTVNTSSVEDFAKKAYSMYKRSYENCGNNHHILASCAYGFTKLPEPWRNKRLGEECILSALEISPDDSKFNYWAGHIFRTNPDRSKYYFARALENGNFTACFSLLEIKHKENSEYDPTADIERYLRRYLEKHQKTKLQALLGGYYYHVKRDANAALERWLPIAESDIRSPVLKHSYLPWNIEEKCINIHTLIDREIRLRIQNTRDDEETARYKRILDEYEKDPLLAEQKKAFRHPSYPRKGQTASATRQTRPNPWRRAE